MYRSRNRDLWKTIAVFALLALLLGCRTIAPPVTITQDRAGETLYASEVPETGSRKETPAGVAPRNVTAEVKTKTGAKAIIVKRPFREPIMYLNEQARAEGLTVTQPKDPWWKWPVFFLAAVGIALGIYFLNKLKSILFFWRR